MPPPKAKGELNAALSTAHDDLFYKATGLSDFGDKEELDYNAPEKLYGEEMARKVLDGEHFTTRPALRKQLMYLLYFGIGGVSLGKASQHTKAHLNGRKAGAGSTRDSALNHFVAKSKVVRTCIFEVAFSHNAAHIEQAGIEFVTTTDKHTHTNVRTSNQAYKHNVEHMYYYMILVLDPDFSAEEIRDAKRVRSKNTKGCANGAGSRPLYNRKRKLTSTTAIEIEHSSDEEWDGEGKGKGKGKRICR
jgi:hypothetical protein